MKFFFILIIASFQKIRIELKMNSGYDWIGDFMICT